MIHDVKWGTEKQGGTRVRLSDAGWKEPLKWNRAASHFWCGANCELDVEGNIVKQCESCRAKRPRVFCASLADVFEDWDGSILDHLGNQVLKCWACGAYERDDDFSHVCPNREDPISDRLPRRATMDDLRADLFRLIDATPNLDWMLLTKRPGNIRRMWPKLPTAMAMESQAADECILEPEKRRSVWLGTSCSDQEAADKAIPELLKCRDLARVLFVSAEPLIGPITFDSGPKGGPPRWLTGEVDHDDPALDLIITGGESGPNARPCRPEWIRFVGQQCQAAGVKWFNKQLGSNIVTRNDMVEDQFNSRATGWPDPDVEYDIHGFREDYQGADCRIRLRDPKGGNMDEWPEDLRVREMPT